MLDIKIGETELVTLPERVPPWRDAPPHGAESFPVSIRAREDALRAVQEHAAASLDEVGGLLVGEAFKWEDRYYVSIETVVPAVTTDAGPGHLVFTAEAWAGMIRHQERDYPDKRLVGWYHSHPRMGIFMSPMDLSIHESFFSQPWHVALVVNGQDQKAGFFAWDDGVVSAATYRCSPPASNEQAANRAALIPPWLFLLVTAAGSLLLAGYMICRTWKSGRRKAAVKRAGSRCAPWYRRNT